ncbi:MAG: hypothetical protein RBS88_11335 [Spongiibacteraceae bacterium]|jgi:hypothetical protein|nr:hypothetical protein [Spongiibacteraceae bacterium]
MKRWKGVSGGFVLLMAGVLSACGGGGNDLSGEYGQAEAGQWFTILNFQGGDQVTLTMIGDPDSHRGTYTREGDSVTVNVMGESRTLRIDGDGCLDGGAGNSLFSGVICKKP